MIYKNKQVIYIRTVGPRLSEPSVIRTLFRSLKSFNFQQNQVINGMPTWYLGLWGLLYHTTVDRKALLACTVFSATHAIH